MDSFSGVIIILDLKNISECKLKRFLKFQTVVLWSKNKRFTFKFCELLLNYKTEICKNVIDFVIL